MNSFSPVSSKLRLPSVFLSLVLIVGTTSAQAQVALVDEPRPSVIRVQMTDDGAVFADSRGKTLYFGADPKPGVSNCTKKVFRQATTLNGDLFDLPNQDRVPSCLDKWPAVEAGNASAVGAWTVIDRPDGIRQWAYYNKPVYTSVKDDKPGDVNGVIGGRGGDRGRAPIFAPVILPPEVTIRAVGIARILATSEGHALYTSNRDSVGKSSCTSKCATEWKPLSAPALATPKGDWSIVLRPDQSKQWAFKGKPLYTYAEDSNPGDVEGDKRPGWQVALAYPKPELPDLFTTRPSLIGTRYSDRDGKSMYVYTCSAGLKTDDGSEQQMACDDPADKSLWWVTVCTDEKTCADIWRPVLAGPNAHPKGTIWTVVDVPLPWAPVRTLDSKQQSVKVWAYRGRPLFTYKFEDRPGMIDGERVGIGSLSKWVSVLADGEIGPTVRKSEIASR